MKNRKYNILLLILLISILLNLVLMNRPFHISSEEASILQVPWYFWILLVAITIQIIRIALMENSVMVNVFLAVAYYFVFYIFNLFYILLPIQVDIGDSSFFMYLLTQHPTIDMRYYNYFEFPIFFILTKSFMVLFGAPPRDIINIGFFILILSMPILLILIIQRFEKDQKLQFFLYPTALLLMIYFFLNDQFVPQLLGLLFLFCVVGLYQKFLNTGSRKLYYLTILFYILCVFTHPFIFIFFPLGIIIQRFFNRMTTPVGGLSKNMKILESVGNRVNEHDTLYMILRNIIRESIERRDTLFRFLKERIWLVKMKLMGKKPIGDVSLVLLGVIYLIGYVTRFTSMRAHYQTMLLPTSQRGGSWVILSRLLGSRQKVGILTFDTYPLYKFVPETYFLILRYVIVGYMITMLILMVIGLANTSKKKIHAFDWNFTLGTSLFIVGGFLTPTILGGRSLQVTSLTMSKYFIEITRTTKWLRSILVFLLITSPLLFTVNFFVNDSLSGNQHIEDIGTITGGIFVEKYSEDNTSVICPDRVFYPIQKSTLYRERPEGEKTVTIVSPYDIVTGEINASYVDVVIYSPKVENRMYYYGIKEDSIRGGRITIYDQGSTKVLY